MFAFAPSDEGAVSVADWGRDFTLLFSLSLPSSKSKILPPPSSEGGKTSII